MIRTSAPSGPSALDLGANLALLARRRAEIDGVLASLLRHGTRVALVNFPNHRNVGDPLLWLGARRSLERIGVRVAYECAWDTFSLGAARRRIGDAPILINGGGNLGDVYQGQQGLREQILQRCADHRVIQLPQSTWFRDPARAEAMGRQIAAHGGVTLLLRDRASLAFAREHLRAVETLFCHDAALGNEPMVRRPARAEVSVLTRNDDERLREDPLVPGEVAEVHDWVISPEGVEGDGWTPLDSRLLHLNTSIRRLMTRPGWPGTAARTIGWRPLAATFQPLAEAWVNRGVEMASAGRVVVTDRAHGHLLALLLGIPSVVVDTSNRKVSGIVEASTGESPLTHTATDLGDALSIARRLTEGAPACGS